MKTKLHCLVFLCLIGFAATVSSKTVTLTPTGGDDAGAIQTALNSMDKGDIIQLNGKFIIKRTLYLPSDIKWILSGSITVGSGSDFDDVGWVGSVNGVRVDAKRPTGIAEKNWNSTGSSGIDMSGGLYDGNYIKSGSRVRLINFARVSNSKFHDFEIRKASDDNFTLGPGCSGNECSNLVSSLAGLSDGSESGNALTDKGHHNKWIDCLAKECTSDGFTPKCVGSEFIRCIAIGNKGPGYGMYCRLDGASDRGTSIDSNKFYACEAYNNGGSGFSFNISETCGTGGTIRNNYVQARCYNNRETGVRFRNKMPKSIISNNEIDLICYGNKGLSSTGVLTTIHGGLGTEMEPDAPVIGITGSIIAYSNMPCDVNLSKATGCNITAFEPSDVAKVTSKVIATNTLTLKPCICPALTTDPWCVKTYLQNFCSPAGVSASPWPEKSLNITAGSSSDLTHVFTLDGRKMPGRFETGSAKGIVIQAFQSGALTNSKKIIR